MSVDMKSLASDLDSFLKIVDTAPAKPAACPTFQKVESVVAAPPQIEEVVDPTTDPTKLVRAAWDYVCSKVQESDQPQMIGEAFMLAVSALSQDADVPLADMQEAAIGFLESIIESARESL